MDSSSTIQRIKDSIDVTLAHIGQFQLIEPSVVPEGLKQIARSISWIVEQVVVQNLRKYRPVNNILSVEDPPHNLTQYDCLIKYPLDTNDYFINIKTSLSQTPTNSRFDVSKASRLIDFYTVNPNAYLILAIVKVDMRNTDVIFRNTIVFNVSWMTDIYYNRANHNVQTSLPNGNDSLIMRSNLEFITILQAKINERGHDQHY